MNPKSLTSCLPFSSLSFHTKDTGFKVFINSRPIGKVSISFLSLTSDKDVIDVTAQRKTLFDELPNVKWEDAVKGQISLQKKITKKPNCIYISALNIKNVLKILERDFNTII